MAWITVSKPNTSSWSKAGRNPTNYPQYGSAIYGTSKYGITDANIKVPKPSTSNWHSIPKPT